ncbi:hypothetical protein CTEN210_12950 [Chaetoceros tenuissimus]|uniref:Peptidase A1 domain-containing protein n=1 Tax=Chaetoceros tenuissimus TaxID=426638 RepID=A0AAD3D5L2_9STRA|nr:hypothetical protein CTEN210_12950 [Chaetoceros tenuissimus]
MREAATASEKQKKEGIRRNDDDSSLTHSTKDYSRLNSDQALYQRRRKRSVEEDTIDGMHFVQYSIGSPKLPKRIRLAVDLNSDYTLINCVSDSSTDLVPAISLPSQSNTFDPINCETCSTGKCEISESGEERCILSADKWTSYLARDVIHTSLGSFNMEFACMKESIWFSRTLQQSANGIIGLSTAQTSFIQQMYQADIIDAPIFSLCFEQYQDEDLNNAGSLSIGSASALDSQYFTSALYYMESFNLWGNYGVMIRNIYLRKDGGTSIAEFTYFRDEIAEKLDFEKFGASFPSGAIIDNLQTQLSLNVAINNSFIEVWERQAGRSFTYDLMQLTKDEFQRLPTILLQVKASDVASITNGENLGTVGIVGSTLDPDSPNDIVIAIPSSLYMIEETSGFYRMQIVWSNQGSILGTNIFQKKQLVFDPNSYRIGIAGILQCMEEESDETYYRTDDPNYYQAPSQSYYRTTPPTATSQQKQPTVSPPTSGFQEFRPSNYYIDTDGNTSPSTPTSPPTRIKAREIEGRKGSRGATATVWTIITLFLFLLLVFLGYRAFLWFKNRNERNNKQDQDEASQASVSLTHSLRMAGDTMLPPTPARKGPGTNKRIEENENVNDDTNDATVTSDETIPISKERYDSDDETAVAGNRSKTREEETTTPLIMDAYKVASETSVFQ